MDSNPNSNKKILNAIVTATIIIFSVPIQYLLNYTKSKYEYLKSLANASARYIYTRAYYLWSNRSLLFTNGITISNRRGSMAGKNAILLVVYIVVAFLVATILFPIAMTQVTSAVTTSWNAAVSTTYVILLPVLVIIALALHFLGLF